jgi:transcriptional regulator with XRE-family HTH domain
MANIVDRSVHTIHKIECGKLGLSKEVASRMARETGVRLEWLLAGDTEADPTDVDGKPYTRDVYQRTQASKIRYDRPHELLRNLIYAGFVGRMIAILEGSGGDFSMCAYKVHSALESLRREFGQDQKLYPIVDPRATNYGTDLRAVPLLEKLIETCKSYDLAWRKLDELDQAKLEPSQRPSKKRRRKV